MSKVCKRHMEHPVRIYNQCIGCELERLTDENRKLREELERKDKQLTTEVLLNEKLVMQLQSAQQEIAELKTTQELWRDINPSVYDMHTMIAELIEGLRWYETAGDYELSSDGGQRARIILKEIGVMVDRQQERGWRRK